jgi:hypothetical protein
MPPSGRSPLCGVLSLPACLMLRSWLDTVKQLSSLSFSGQLNEVMPQWDF